MKNLPLVLGALGLGLGGLMLMRDAHAKAGENLTFVTGKSGTPYAISIEETDGGQFMTVMNADMTPLFMYLQTAGGPRIFQESFDAEQGELAKALADFQPMQGV